MPGSAGTSVDHIEERLRASLGDKPRSLDAKLQAASHKVLMSSVTFVPAQQGTSSHLEQLRAKYTPLNAGQWQGSPHREQNTAYNVHNKQEKVSSPGTKVLTSPVNNHQEPPKPRICLYDGSQLRHSFDIHRGAGAGLKNLGNTCFFNSTLQCLCYSPVLFMALQAHRNCSVKDCMTCVLGMCLRRMQMGNFRDPQAPAALLQKMRMHCKHMQIGRQEDAHECLRYLVDLMQKASLFGKGKLDEPSKHTTMIAQVFGGYLRSQVQCSRCKHMSNTFDPMMDISLDIKNAHSLSEALHQFIRPEWLSGDNAYTCARCKQKVTARKHFTIHQPPRTMIIQFKRFDFSSMFGKKLSKHVAFTETFNLRPFMSQRQGDRVLYHLCGIIVHSGFSCNSGHYYAYCKAPNNKWYLFNDTFVQAVSIKRVLEAEAYLLFYTRSNTSTNGHVVGPQNQPSSVRPQPQATFTPTAAKANGDRMGILSKLSNELGSAVARQVQPQTIPVPGAQSKSNPKPLPATWNRERVQFGIKLGGKDQKSGDVNGTPEVKPTNGHKVVKKPVTSSPGSLVPYQGESSDDEVENSAVKSANNGTKQAEKPTDPSPKSDATRSPVKSGEPVLDSRLQTTLTVPGAYKSLDQGEPRSFSKEKAQERAESPVKHRSSAGSPVKRGLVPLSVSCPLTPTSKLNATTPWQVLDADAQMSPSLASGSSCNSVNSTTEWQVTPNKEKPQTVPAELTPGWRVTPLKSCLKPTAKTIDASPIKTNGRHEHRQVSSTASTGDSSSSSTHKQSEGLLTQLSEHSKSMLTDDRPRGTDATKSEEVELGDEASNHKHHKKNKKKKKKKHKREYDDEEERPILSSSEEGELSSGSSTPSKRPRLDAGDYESEHWSGPGSKVQKVSSPPVWDGKRSNNDSVVKELIKTSSARGYGVHVESWVGGRSTIDEDVARDKAFERKRSWHDDYEEDLDRGKTKKVKAYRDRDTPRPKHNPFQAAHNRNIHPHGNRNWSSPQNQWQPQRHSGGYQNKYSPHGSPYPRPQQPWRGRGPPRHPDRRPPHHYNRNRDPYPHSKYGTYHHHY